MVADAVAPYVAEWSKGSVPPPEPVIVIGDAPIAVNDVHDTEPEQETEVVATPLCVELPQYVRYPAAVVVVPVPPFAIPKVPVISDARSTSAVPIAPPVALRKPEKLVSVSPANVGDAEVRMSCTVLMVTFEPPT